VPFQSPGHGSRIYATQMAEDRYIVPPVDIYETDEGLAMVFDVPGVTTEDIDVRVAEGILTIKAGVSLPRRKSPLFEEFTLPGYFRQFQLSDEMDDEKISANLKNGVLTLKLPKSEKAKPKRIDVKVS